MYERWKAKGLGVRWLDFFLALLALADDLWQLDGCVVSLFVRFAEITVGIKDFESADAC